MQTPLKATLDYADLPPGSRLIVERSEDVLRITDPPTGIWRQFRGFLLGWALSAAIFLSLMFAVLHWKFPQFSGVFGLAVVRRMLGGLLSWEVAIVLLIVLVGAAVAGRVGTTIVVDELCIRVTSRVRLLGFAWPSERIVSREEITQVNVGRWSRRVRIDRANGKPIFINLWGGGADARWVARAIRHELGLAD